MSLVMIRVRQVGTTLTEGAQRGKKYDIATVIPTEDQQPKAYICGKAAGGRCTAVPLSKPYCLIDQPIPEVQQLAPTRKYWQFRIRFFTLRVRLSICQNAAVARRRRHFWPMASRPLMRRTARRISFWPASASQLRCSLVIRCTAATAHRCLSVVMHRVEA